MKELTKLRLRGIITCSFTRSEATNLALYKEDPGYPARVMRSCSSPRASTRSRPGLDQVSFVFRPVTVTGEGEIQRTVFDSRRLRLDGGTWHPYMLQNYVEAVGLQLEGVRKLEQILDDQRRAKRATQTRE